MVTYSAVENFTFASWRDFSDLRLVDPSPAFPIIEVEVALNFFPGDHFTAERYKAFVVQVSVSLTIGSAVAQVDCTFTPTTTSQLRLLYSIRSALMSTYSIRKKSAFAQ